MNFTMFTGGLVAGLLGFAHCVGMCGGLCAALGMGRKGFGGLLFLLFYQLGRITTYTLLGWAGANVGAAILFNPTFSTFAKSVMIASDVMVIGMCIAGLGIIPKLRVPFSEPDGLTGTVASFVRITRLAPAPVAALILGLVLGLMPCGLLYPVLINAALTAEPSQGAFTMLGFGLGTAPALLLFGAVANRLRGISFPLLKLAWVVVGVMGAINLYRHIMNWSVVASCCE